MSSVYQTEWFLFYSGTTASSDSQKSDTQHDGFDGQNPTDHAVLRQTGINDKVAESCRP